MRTIYLDADFRCHVENDGTMTAVDTVNFDSKCSDYINGYRYVPEGQLWRAPDGTVFRGEMMAPWKDWKELDAAQRKYERQQLADIAAELADAKAALEMLGVTAGE